MGKTIDDESDLFEVEKIQGKPLLVFDDTHVEVKKKYLILFYGEYDEGYEYQMWKFIEGKQEAYDYIRDIFLSEELADDGVVFDAYKSRIIVQSDSGKIRLDGISIYRFIKKLVIENLVDQDANFDIDEWKVDEEEGQKYGKE